MIDIGRGRSELYLLSRLQRQTRDMFASRIAAYDITVPMFRVLFEIKHSTEGLTSSELARRTFVSVQTVNLVVQTLAERGIIDRSPTGHGRGLALSLTDAGEELLADLRAEHAAVVESMTRHSGIDGATIRDILTKLITSVERTMAETVERSVRDDEGDDPS